jgi:signal recognition particle subunit SEC65
MEVAKEYKGKTSVVIYPAYINSKITVSHGRRVSISNAIENPTINEIGIALTRIGLPTEFEVFAHIAPQVILQGLDEPRQVQGHAQG